jgi:glycosyltransferase involved in cell wall biosynthesis
MKIVMLCDFYSPALSYQENFLTKYYTKHGHRVVVVAATFESIFDYMSDRYNKKVKANEETINGSRIIKLPYSLNIFHKLRRFNGKRVSQILTEEKPDLIFSHNIALNLWEVVKYKKKNPACRIIMDYHTDYSNSAKNWLSLNILHKIIRKSFLYAVIKYIDKIYSIVPAGFIFLKEVYGIPYNKMELLPLGVDIDKSREILLQEKGKTVRKELQIPANAFVIFTGGKLDPVKRTDLLMEAVLRLNNPEIHLIVAGDFREQYADYKSRLEEMVKGSEQIHFTGWIKGDEMYHYMNASDMAIFPASQSVLWQQAIGMGLPLILGHVCSVKGKTWVQDTDYLNANNNVIILDKYHITAQEIAQQIKRLADNPDLLDSMKKGALKTAEEFLSYDKIVQQTINE